MSRAGSVFKTLRGWSWLCAALAFVSMVPFALIARSMGQQVHAQIASGQEGCRSCIFQLCALITFVMFGLGIPVALLGTGSFLRLSAPRSIGRCLELLFAVSAPFSLSYVGCFIAMLAYW